MAIYMHTEAKKRDKSTNSLTQLTNLQIYRIIRQPIKVLFFLQAALSPIDAIIVPAIWVGIVGGWVSGVNHMIGKKTSTRQISSNIIPLKIASGRSAKWAQWFTLVRLYCQHSEDLTMKSTLLGSVHEVKEDRKHNRSPTQNMLIYVTIIETMEFNIRNLYSLSYSVFLQRYAMSSVHTSIHLWLISVLLTLLGFTCRPKILRLFISLFLHYSHRFQ
jgi:hypothetical protein